MSVPKKKVVKLADTGSSKSYEPKKRRKVKKATQLKPDFIFGKKNYLFMLIGLGVIILGLILMIGGHQEPNSWNVDEIYSPVRITLAPLLMLIGFGIEIYAIFVETPEISSPEEV